MILNTGRRPNRLILSFNTFNVLQRDSTVLSRVQYSSLGIVTEELIAKLFSLDKVIVATQVVNSEDEELGTDAHTGGYLFEQTSGKGSAFLYYYGPSGLKKPNAGYICTLPIQGTTRSVSKYREENRFTDVYVAQEEFSVETSFAADLGKLYVDTIVT